MRKLTAFAAALALFCAAGLSAENDQREPGLYTVDGEDSVKMNFINGVCHSSTHGPYSSERYHYKRPTAETTSKGEFILVCDMSKTRVVDWGKTYDVFVSRITPDSLNIIPLTKKRKSRVTRKIHFVGDIYVHGNATAEFTWEKITDNSYRIKADLVPGEYAVTFKPWFDPTRSGFGMNYERVFDFKVVEEAKEE